jgi:hypothetical protein
MQYRGDGDCDDQNNTEECGYDGGDCCGDNVKTKYCTECQCLEVQQQWSQTEVSVDVSKFFVIKTDHHSVFIGRFLSILG